MIQTLFKRGSFSSRVAAAMLALALILLQIPVSFADGDGDSPALELSSTVSVGLDLNDAYIECLGQTVSSPSTKLDAPAKKDLEFTVQADGGYQVESVSMSLNGATQELQADSDGVYTVAAKNVVSGLSISVETSKVESEQLASSAAVSVAQDSSDAAASSSVADAASPESFTKSVYTYTSDEYTVTATLEDVTAIPDNAQLVVTPVTSETQGYNYGAYMEALNDTVSSSGDEDAYTSENTLLFDVAFMVPQTDESGNATEDAYVEVEPASGSVSYSVAFKDAQLSDDLGVTSESASSIEINHLVLSEAAMADAASTQEATSITASDISVEGVSADSARVEGEESLSFSTTSNSIISITSGGTATKYNAVGEQLTYVDVLGNARYFGIVADTWQMVESETNAAVNVLYQDQQSGNDLTAGDDRQPWFIGTLANSYYGQTSWWPTAEYGTIVKTFMIKGRDADVYTPAENDPYILSNGNVTFHDTSLADVNEYVNSMLSDAATKSAEFASKNSIVGALPTPCTDGSDPDHMTTNYVIDVTSYGSGTYYLNLDSVYYDYLANQSGSLNIKCNSDQTVVINLTRSGDVNLQKFSMTIDGVTYWSDNTNAADEPIAQHLVWNLPNATTVNLIGSVAGMLLAPNGTVNVMSTSAGWVVAKEVVSSSGEWHDVWQSVDQHYQKVSTQAHVSKSLSGATLQEGQFQFQLLDAYGNVLQTVSNDADGSISFEDISYRTQGTYTYYIREVIPSGATDNGDGTYSYGGVVYDGTVHTMTVNVYAAVQNYSQELAASVTYDDGSASSVVFSNSTTGLTSTSLSLGASKTLDGMTLQEGQFQFQLVDANGNVLQTASNDADGNVSFDAITYDSEGAYDYVIREVIPAGATQNADGSYSYANVSYDPHEESVTVTVADDGSGQLVATPTYATSGGEATYAFSNAYTGSASLSLSATKVLSGRTLVPGEFQFVVVKYDENWNYIETLGTATCDDSGVVSFSNIDSYTFEDVGKSYIYQLFEVIPDGAVQVDSEHYVLNGVTYDAHSEWAYVQVSYDSASQSIVTNEDLCDIYGWVFRNAYNASASFTLDGVKTLQNASFTGADALTFTLQATGADASSAPMPETNTVTITPQEGSSAAFSFGAIEFDLDDVGHTYTYVVTESASMSGVSNDARTHTVSLSIADNGDGTLSVTPTYYVDDQEVSQVEFVNTYSASGSVQFAGAKTMQGRALADGDSFAFDISENGQVIATAYNDATGKISYPAITYGLADVGEHVYTVTERSVNAAGVTSSDQAYTVVVNVADNGDGTLSVTTSDNAQSLDFTNTYVASGSASIVASKTVSGHSLAEGQFSFVLTDESGAVLQTKANDAQGNVAFDSIAYTQDDAGKTFVYYVSEVNDGQAGYTYDTSSKRVEVSVSDNGDGTLSTQVTYDDGSAAFQNAYSASGSATFQALKQLSGRDLQEGQFSFVLKDASGNTLQTVQNAADGTVSFDAVSYTQAGTYAYTITEVIPEGSTQVEGQNLWKKGAYVYDGHSVDVTVVVTDDGAGHLVSDVSYSGGTTFQNAYEATGSVALSAMKTLNGVAPSEGAFQFELSDASGVIETVSNAANGTVNFSDITYTQAGTYSYVIREVIPEGATSNGDGTYTYDRYTYDGHSEQVTVEVVDDGEGHLVAMPTYEHGSALFSNAYAATGSYTPQAIKTLDGMTLQGGAFSFTVRDSQGNVVSSGTNDASGSVAFSSISYTLDDMADATVSVDGTRTKTFEYTLSEDLPAGVSAQAPTLDGITYDTSTHRLSVTVTDDGTGALSTSAVYDGDASASAATFANAYNASGSFVLECEKYIEGRTFSASDSFRFVVSGECANDASVQAPLPAQTSVNVTPEPGAGFVRCSFDAIPFTLADAGNTYVYTVVEQATMDGVTNDADVHTVTVQVSDNGDGTLSVQAEYSDGERLVFTNTYDASGQAAIAGTKVLQNARLAQGQFQFQLTDSDGNVIQAVSNDEYGAFAFDAISYDLADLQGATSRDFTYHVSELGADVNGIAYDTHVEDVTVRVTDTGTGTLATQVLTDADGVTFTNVYNATGSLELSAEKQITGRSFQQGDSFTFQVSAAEGTPMPSQTSVTITPDSGSSAAIDFGSISYGLADVGKQYTYTISEVVPEGATLNADGTYTQNGITYDAQVHTVTVTVSDNGFGKLSVDAAYSDGESGCVFVNSYDASGSANLFATKSLLGRTLQQGEFAFQLSGDGVMETARNDESGLASFAPITYTLADVGTHEYQICELPGTVAGVTYDTHVETVTVQVEDNGDGTLSVTYDGQDVFAGAAFANSYDASGSIQLTGHKDLSGRAIQAGQFQFTLSGEGIDSQTVSNDANGDFAFADLAYTLSDVGEHVYTIVENVPEGATLQEDGTYVLNGYTYDAHVEQVVVTVLDNGDGTLAVSAAYGSGSSALFQNSYATSDAQATIQVEKTLSGRAWTESDAFAFTLSPQGSAPGQEQVATATAATGGIASFDALAFTMDDVADVPVAADGTRTATFTYALSEVIPEGATQEAGVYVLDGVAYDASVHSATVTLVDDGAGHLSATVSYDDESSDAATFTNAYGASDAYAQVSAEKQLTGAALQAGQFQFTLQGTSDNAAGTTATVSNAADGSVAFPVLSYSAAGTYTYSIAEVIPEGATDNGDGTYTLGAYTYTSETHVATVTVADDGVGHLQASVSYDDDSSDAPVFENSYFQAQHALSVAKFYYGDAVNPTFEFTLTALDDDYSERAGESASYGASSEVIDAGQAFTVTVSNASFDEQGEATVAFPQIAYQQPGAYHYRIEEVQGSSSIACDTAVYYVDVTVSESMNVTASWSVQDGTDERTQVSEDSVAFYNNDAERLGYQSLSLMGYTEGSASTQVYPQVHKTLDGSFALQAGAFHFQLLDEGGNVVADATNDADGLVSFFEEGSLGIEYTLDDVGVHTYSIVELAGSDSGVTYDGTTIVYTVVVSAVDSDGDGANDSLQTEETYTVDGRVVSIPVFRNTTEGMSLRVQKVSREGGEGLEGSTYALWMASSDGSADALIAEATSDASGYITFDDVRLLQGAKYYLKEVEAPAGHKVDPRRTACFCLNEAGDGVVLCEGTTDGLHAGV
ncbi:MAG: hypothetical protein E7002_04505 [Denitrobacterium detoxificans]|nr:hypothetical protein [Denitrobacterium detoxificans]